MVDNIRSCRTISFFPYLLLHFLHIELKIRLFHETALGKTLTETLIASDKYSILL